MLARRAFSRGDLLAVIALLLLCAAALPAQLFMARERANRAKCANNLRQICQGLMLYANDNRNLYPILSWDADAKPTAYTPAPAANDVTGALYLLVRQTDLSVDTFVCPSSDATKWDLRGKKVSDFNNFPSSDHLSYSYANPYASKAAREAGYKLTAALAAGFAVLADMNPGSAALTRLTAESPADAQREGNSRNHRQAGQNVAYADGSVGWQATCFAGIKKDNIYTFGPSGETSGGTGIHGSATGPTDSILLPTAEQGKPASRPATRPVP